MADKLKFNRTIDVDSYTNNIKTGITPVQTLSEQIIAMSNTLGLDATITSQIEDKFKSYDESIFTLIENPDLINLINELLRADNQLSKVLLDPNNNFNSIPGFKDNWNKLMTQFLHLQGLIIIKKINKNITVGINSIIDALVNKLTLINNLIEKNLI